MKILFQLSLILALLISTFCGCKKESPTENTTENTSVPKNEDTVWRPTKEMWMTSINNNHPDSGLFITSDSGFSVKMLPISTTYWSPSKNKYVTTTSDEGMAWPGVEITFMNDTATHAKLFYKIQFNPPDTNHTNSLYAMFIGSNPNNDFFSITYPQWDDPIHTVHDAFRPATVEFDIPQDCFIRKSFFTVHEYPDLKDGEVLISGFRFRYATYDPDGYNVYTGAISVTDVSIQLY